MNSIIDLPPALVHLHQLLSFSEETSLLLSFIIPCSIHVDLWCTDSPYSSSLPLLLRWGGSGIENRLALSFKRETRAIATRAIATRAIAARAIARRAIAWFL